MKARHDRASASRSAASGCDLLSDVLRSVRLTGSMLFLVEARSPWISWAPQAELFRPVVLPAAQHLVSYHIVTAGRCWAAVQGAAPELFETGDVLVVPHGDAYYLADPPDAQPSYGSDQALAFFKQMAAGELPTLVNEGGGESARAQFICGFLGCDRRPLNPVLSALPAMLHLRAAPRRGDRLQHLVEFALGELRERSSGGHEVLKRLAELMFVEVARRHLDSIDDRAGGWLAGLHDPLVARALALLHGDVARRWTLDGLARAVGGSRSVLAERFMQFVGQPPMHYLAQWRLQLAGGLLDAPGAKVVAVADAVGYESAPAFSRAFKKSTGLAPAQWKRRARGG